MKNAIVTVAIIVSTAAGRGAKPRTPILFLHLHKAGGTSFCALFHSAGLRTRGDDDENSRREEKSDGARCNCHYSVFNFSAPDGGAAHTAAEMAARGYNVCMLEETYRYPKPDELLRFASNWRRRGGVVATSLREPWERFRSNFLREDVRVSKVTIKQFAKRSFGETDARVVKYGSFNRPNYYVRALNGLDRRPGLPEAKIGARELENAVRALAAMDYVFLLDGDVQPTHRRDILGRDVPMPRESNSRYSAAKLLADPARLEGMPETASYEARFRADNCPDAALFAVARRRVQKEGSCAGCRSPPEEAFERTEHRPRCLAQSEILRDAPALWDTFRGYWRDQ